MREHIIMKVECIYNCMKALSVSLHRSTGTSSAAGVCLGLLQLSSPSWVWGSCDSSAPCPPSLSFSMATSLSVSVWQAWLMSVLGGVSVGDTGDGHYML